MSNIPVSRYGNANASLELLSPIVMRVQSINGKSSSRFLHVTAPLLELRIGDESADFSPYSELSSLASFRHLHKKYIWGTCCRHGCLVCAVLGEWHVPCQCHPVQLRHLSGLRSNEEEIFDSGHPQKASTTHATTTNDEPKHSQASRWSSIHHTIATFDTSMHPIE